MPTLQYFNNAQYNSKWYLIENDVSLSLKHLFLYATPKGHCKVVNVVERLLQVLELPPPPLNTGDLLAFWCTVYTPEKHLDVKASNIQVSTAVGGPA
jgi:hypothetical protein